MGTKRVGWARIRSLINENTNQINIGYRKVITNTTTEVLTESQSGAIITTSGAGARTITLPAAAAGLNYDFHFGATFTGTLVITAATSADTYQGVLQVVDKDELGGLVALDESVDTTAWVAPAAADYIFTADADTDGRFIGSRMSFVAISDSIWLLSGVLFGDGTVTHPFS